MSETVTLTLPRAALVWAASGRTGMSSLCIFRVMSGCPEPDEYWRRNAHPLDPSDFGRCYTLLGLVPEWRARLPEMAAVSPVWARMVERWADMEALYEQAMASDSRFATELYRLMLEVRG